jgi:hypothetical protein
VVADFLENQLLEIPLDHNPLEVSIPKQAFFPKKFNKMLFLDGH